MQPPLGRDRIAERAGDGRRAVGAAEHLERALAAVGDGQLDAVVAELPARVADRRGDLAPRRRAPELVDRCDARARPQPRVPAPWESPIDIAALDATAQAELVRNGSVSRSELGRRGHRGRAAVNPQINAIIHPRYEAARWPRRPTPGGGPFAGVPMVMKDLGCMMKGEPYHAGHRGP